MNRRTLVAASIGATPVISLTSSADAHGLARLQAALDIQLRALQTNSDTPTPDLATLPWEEVVYLGMLSTWYEVLRDSLGTFFNGLEKLKDDLASMSLRKEVALGIGVWPHLFTDVAKVSPPSEFADTHGFLKDALSELNTTSGPLALGVIRGDADSLKESLDGLESADASLRSFVASLPYAVPDRSELTL